MKKWKGIALLLAIALLFSVVPVSAETGTQAERVTEADESNMKTEEVSITDENWYHPVYYQEPEKRYPQSSAGTRSVRSVSLSLEDYVVSELEKLPDSIDVSAYQISIEERGTPFFQILNQHPEFFYVGKSLSYSYGNNGYISKYFIEYEISKNDIPEYRNKLEEEVDLAVAQVDSAMSDVEKALTVHDYLALHCEYDYDRLNNGTLPEISHSAYGSLVERMAVCDGYASAFSYIMKERFGIPCTVVSSGSMSHAWNMIKIDGKWYHVDVTWDDPVRDLIGRVTHKYFLLSDSAISGNAPKHEGWSTENSADSVDYDNAFWTDITSAIIYNQGEWFYSQYNSSANKVNLVKKASLFGDYEIAVYAGEVWGSANSYYPSSFMYLSKENEKIYFNTKSDIRRLNSDGTTDIVYQPTVPADQWIYGFVIRGNQLCYAVQAGPNLTSKQNVQIAALKELELPEIEGIRAENVQVVYDGTAKTILVTGTQPNDKVYYALENSTAYSESQPVMVDAGTYQVSYRVERSGHQPCSGKATVTIEQGTPEYTTPTGLKGNSGRTLGSVELPAGFVWQTEESTKLFTEGTFPYLVRYVPEDTKNYKEVSDIPVQVTVSCPGHNYKSVVNKEPTETEPGERLYTCETCGNTYTEEIERIDPNKPEIEGIRAENVQVVYDGTAKTILVTGMQPNDKIYYALENSMAYSESQPVMVDAGTYQVSYRVERSGCQPCSGKATVTIEQGTPEYTTPTGLKGNSGRTLGSVELPTGFVWQTEENTKLVTEGTFPYLVRYVPEDTKNYKEVSDIPVQVTVSCPGHNYKSLVSKEPTTVQKGLKIYTCEICNGTYTEEMAMLVPQKPGNVSGQKVSQATANSLKFTWNKVSGVSYELVFYKGKSKVSAKDVSGSSITFSKLKGATEYSLKITPFKKIDGQKVYAAKSATVIAATAPTKVKLSSLKKQGSRKAKLTWKKVTGASGYEVYMKTGKGKYSRVKAYTQGKSISYTKSGLKKGKTYSFRVRAYKKVGMTKVYGSYSSAKSLKIK